MDEMKNGVERLDKVLESLTKADLMRIIKEYAVKNPGTIENLLPSASKKVASTKNPPPDNASGSKMKVAAVSSKSLEEGLASLNKRPSSSIPKIIASGSKMKVAAVSCLSLEEGFARIKRRLFSSAPKITHMNLVLTTLNAGKGEDGYCELYCVDNVRNEVTSYGGGKLHSTSIGSHRLSDLSDDSFGSTVIVNGVAYVLDYDDEYVGGQDEQGYGLRHFHHRASCFDLSKPNVGWKPAPMPRSLDPKPRCATLNGKIFSFRKTWTGTGPFLEVLDTTTSGRRNRWEAFPPPPEFATCRRLTVSNPVITDGIYNRILVHVKEHSSVYAYYPYKNKWSCIVGDEIHSWNKTVALCDGIIYFHGHRRTPFKAYHLIAQKWLKVVIPSEFEDNHSDIITDRYQALIADMGSGLCLAKSSHDFNFPNKTFLRFPRFMVEHTSTEAIITPISVKEMTIQTECAVIDFLPLVSMDLMGWKSAKNANKPLVKTANKPPHFITPCPYKLLTWHTIEEK